ncbi:hypothetical protein M9458_050582 [Cirrhinus mrigala]|uniref:Endonuclease/exonuclease/phosphatase domain-containing protein n=1 Tax=Cirrhinus mrigala TaxID=683832 RepID=A0ABD0MY02_CIRMR
MAASVCCSFVLFLFLFVCPVLSNVFPISFSRNELLDIRNSTSDNFLPTFEHSDVLLDILVGGAALLYKRSKRRKRGKRAGALVKFRQRGFRTPLPSIHLANLRSLANKSDELQLLTGTNKDFLIFAALCFTETWLNGTIPDSALHLTGFQLIRADRVTDSSGKTRGGGLCFYINEGWCTDVTVLNKMCCPNVEAIFINCKPFYSPREFSSFILVSVYIPPDACVSAALELLADQITHTEQRYPDSFIIVLGDFNKAHLTRELPKYRQHITCPTRDSNILDHCYTVLKDAYHSAPVQRWDSLITKLESAKPVVRTVKRWTVEAERDLQACFELTDWSVFEAAATDLDELTVTSYISFCEDMCVPTRTYLTFNNDKPWFSAKLKQLRQAKEDAYRSGDKALYKQAKYTLNREIRVAKLNYSGKLKKQLSRNDSKSVWNGLKAITSYKSPSPSPEANQQLADDLNEFYCRFEKQKTAQLSTPCPSIPPTVSQPALKICEGDVGLIRDGDESAYRQGIEQLSLWRSHNNLELNTLKTVEMTVDFRRKPPALPPLTIMNSTVAAVDSFKFLGTNISQDLKWDIRIDSIVKKAQQSYPCNDEKQMLAESVVTLFPSLKIKMEEEDEGFEHFYDTVSHSGFIEMRLRNLRRKLHDDQRRYQRKRSRISASSGVSITLDITAEGEEDSTQEWTTVIKRMKPSPENLNTINWAVH